MMNKKIIADHIIEVFKDYTVKDQLKMTKDVSIIRELFVNKYGLEKWTELHSASLENWRDAWKLFEQHHGIFTHGDYEKLMNE
jgi:hypothetical protein